jgi:dipeptidyl aminopeptidase/acylaminoacyl peptidase
MAVNVDGSQVATLLAPEKFSVEYFDSNGRDWQIVDLLDKDDDNILISRYELSAPEVPYLYRLNVKTGKKSLVVQSRYRYGDFMTDHNGTLRFQGGTERDGVYVLLYRDSEAADWKEIGRYSTANEHEGRFGPLAFAADNKRIYFEDARNAATSGLYLIDTEKSGEPELLYRNEKYDLGGLLPSREQGVYIGVTWRGDRSGVHYFNPNDPNAAFLASLTRAFSGRDVSVVQYSDDGSKALIYAESDIEPGTYYLLDLTKGTGLARFPSRGWIKSEEMSPMRAIVVKSRDGLDLHGFLTQPKTAPANALKKMVVVVHGGPIGVRDEWGFDPEVQWFAANGYSVLQINYRGSGGYGAKFEGSAYGEWGGKMQDDVTDATLWAIEHGYADKSAICIYGASYGAYSAMMGLVREPDLYRCGVGYVGVYDLEMLQKSSGRREARAFFNAVLGTDAVRLRERSPANRAAEIKAPVLLIHGGSDWRAPIEQFDRMKDALSRANKSVKTIFKKNEDHGFISEANRAEFYQKTIEFMDASIGSR